MPLASRGCVRTRAANTVVAPRRPPVLPATFGRARPADQPSPEPSVTTATSPAIATGTKVIISGTTAAGPSLAAGLGSAAIPHAKIAKETPILPIGAQTKAIGLTGLGGAPVGNPPAPAKGPGARPPQTAPPVGAHNEVTGTAGLTGKEGKGPPTALPARMRPPTDAASDISPVTGPAAPFLG